MYTIYKYKDTVCIVCKDVPNYICHKFDFIDRYCILSSSQTLIQLQFVEDPILKNVITRRRKLLGAKKRIWSQRDWR